MTDTNKPKLMIHCYPEKNEITLDDGNRCVTYPCSVSVMKQCCRILDEILNGAYSDIDFADLPAPSDMSRPLLYRETGVESRDTLPDDAERLYASADELHDANCVVTFMELSPDVDPVTVDKARKRVFNYANNSTVIIRGSSFTNDASYRISLIGIF